jgi:AcrR family transcriptional regulator
MADEEPRWRRRKEARPAEIVAAALEVFSDKGFAAAKLDEIARCAGVSKAALYLYFDTKEELFRAAAATLTAPELARVAQTVSALDAPFAQIAPALLGRIAGILAQPGPARLATMVIGEARNFPDLARIWREDVVDRVIELVAGLIARSQARGEVLAGDPRLFALTLAGPVVMGGLYNAVFGQTGGARLDLGRLAEQHARIALVGLAPHGAPETSPAKES